MTDPISDMLTRIRNALAVKKQEVTIPYSRIKFNLAQILEKENYIKGVKKAKNSFEEIQIDLKYDQEGKPAMRSLKRISKPGCRIYAKKEDLPYVLSNIGMAIISTSKGLMTNKEARKQRLGGEVICEVY